MGLSRKRPPWGDNLIPESQPGLDTSRRSCSTPTPSKAAIARTKDDGIKGSVQQQGRHTRGSPKPGLVFCNPFRGHTNHGGGWGWGFVDQSLKILWKEWFSRPYSVGSGGGTLPGPLVRVPGCPFPGEKGWAGGGSRKGLDVKKCEFGRINDQNERGGGLYLRNADN